MISCAAAAAKRAAEAEKAQARHEEAIAAAKKKADEKAAAKQKDPQELKVEHFCALTGASPKKAREYLDHFDWIVDHAVSEWKENETTTPKSASPDPVPVSLEHSSAGSGNGTHEKSATKMCDFFEKGTCTKGDKCRYAHSEAELRGRKSETNHGGHNRGGSQRRTDSRPRVVIPDALQKVTTHVHVGVKHNEQMLVVRRGQL